MNNGMKIALGGATVFLGASLYLLADKMSKRPEQLPIPKLTEIEKIAQEAAKESKDNAKALLEVSQKAAVADQKAADALTGAKEAVTEAKNVANALDRLNSRLEDVTQKTAEVAKTAHTHEKSTVVEETYNPQLDCENQLRYAKAQALLNSMYNRDVQHGKAALWSPDYEVARLYVAKKWDSDNNDQLSDEELEKAIKANKDLELVIQVDENTKFAVKRNPKFNSEDDRKAYRQLREKVEASGKVTDIEWLYRVVTPYMNKEGFITGTIIQKLEDLMGLR